MASQLTAPFPYFGGKLKAAPLVWDLLGADIPNYVEPFLGSAAMLLARPGGAGKVETVNDKCGFIANFWRALAADPDAVAYWADWPVNEIDLIARHGWLVNRKERLAWSLEDPDFYDAKAAGWWVWGACAWIGSGWCEGKGPWIADGAHVVDSRQLPHLGNAGRGLNRQLPHLSYAGRGLNRQLPHLGTAGRGLNRQLPHLGDAGRGERTAFIAEWFADLSARLRDVRVACGDWKRVIGDSVTTQQGLTGVFLDPPYTKGALQYAAGGIGGNLSNEVRGWCEANGTNPLLRLVLCGHAGEHDALVGLGWTAHAWKARSGYAKTAEATENRKSETVWASPACVRPDRLL